MDTLCCGTLGSIEFLREAGDILNNETMKQLAVNRLKEVIATSHEHGHYAIGVGGTQFNQGFLGGFRVNRYHFTRHFLA